MDFKGRRVLAMILLLMILLTFIGGCGKGNEPAGSKTPSDQSSSGDADGSGDGDKAGEERPLYVIKRLTSPTKIKMSDETVIGEYIKEKFGIVFEFVPYTGDIREKQNLMLAAGDYDEIQDMQREDMEGI